MIGYYSLFIPLMLFSITWKFQGDNLRLNKAFWLFAGIYIVLFIGFREEVGGDWFNYLRHFNSIKYFDIIEIIKRPDPGYYLLNWLMDDWGFKIYSVNFVCAIIFTVGLFIFAKKQPNPWLAISVAVPYLIIVVAMGYTRQAVALGFVFWSLIALDEKKIKKFLILVALAATFHRSAVLMIGLGFFVQGNGKVIRSLSIIIVGIGVWSAFLAEHQQQLWEVYVNQQLKSQGAFIRVAMNFAPSIIFLFVRKDWKKAYDDYKFWRIIAFSSIVSIFLVASASTAVDRVALYFTPIQVVVYSRLPFILRHKLSPGVVTFLILMYYLLVMYVWLNYATHAKFWLPYQTILFKDIL